MLTIRALPCYVNTDLWILPSFLCKEISLNSVRFLIPYVIIKRKRTTLEFNVPKASLVVRFSALGGIPAWKSKQAQTVTKLPICSWSTKINEVKQNDAKKYTMFVGFLSNIQAIHQTNGRWLLAFQCWIVIIPAIVFSSKSVQKLKVQQRSLSSPSV